ncbi:MAG: DeoR family transcriptional regulator, partial [Bacteroidia bacterium]|nr:DeoR family transcriptional regulator [Bacteroidia bacterium]
ERQAEIIRWLVNESDLLLSVNEVQSRFATSYQTARTDLLKLESLKYIESKFTGKKIVYFKSRDFSAKLSNLRFE